MLIDFLDLFWEAEQGTMHFSFFQSLHFRALQNDLKNGFNNTITLEQAKRQFHFSDFTFQSISSVFFIV
jgi:hypothetical protein